MIVVQGQGEKFVSGVVYVVLRSKPCLLSFHMPHHRISHMRCISPRIQPNSGLSLAIVEKSMKGICNRLMIQCMGSLFVYNGTNV
jgi:hypothetical protein